MPCPRVSWRWRAISSSGQRSRTAPTAAVTRLGVAQPIESARATWRTSTLVSRAMPSASDIVSTTVAATPSRTLKPSTTASASAQHGTCLALTKDATWIWDLALAYNPPKDSRLASEALLEEDLYLVGVPSIIGRSTGHIAFADIPQRSVLGLTPLPSSRAIIQPHFLRNQIAPSDTLEIDSLTALGMALQAGARLRHSRPRNRSVRSRGGQISCAADHQSIPHARPGDGRLGRPAADPRFP